MKLLILTNYANGLWLFRKELLLSFMEDGHEVFVSVPPDENVDKLKSLTCGKRIITMIETPFERRGNNPIKDLGLFMKYCQLLKKIKPDMVLTYTIKPNLYGGLACRLKKIPYICNITGLGTAIENGGLLCKILLNFYKISMKKARRVFFQNVKNQNFMNHYGIAQNNSGLLPGSGVNLTEHAFEPYPQETEGIVFLAVIRIMKDKGIEEYLESAKTMSKRYKNLKFWLVGEYEAETVSVYKPAIQTVVDQGIITYFGHIDNVGEVMAKSHIVVHPSYHEGLSNVLLEAAACGRPVLAGNISGCRETFCEGKSGFGFEVKNTQSLIDAMEKILALSMLQRRQMGESGRRWVERRFDRNIVLQAYKDELSKCTKSS